MEREIVSLAVSILLVVIMVRLRMDLGLSMLAGAAALGLVTGQDVAWTAAELGRAAISRDTLLLLGRIVSIISLGALAGKLGYLDRFVNGLMGLIADNRAVVALMPAFGGLLPMPGGTMLTAPMVESAARNGKLRPEEKFFIAYWFRHVWEYIWPLYPGVIVSAALIHRTPRDIFLANYPLTIAAIVGGVLFVLRRVDAGRNVRRNPSPSHENDSERGARRAATRGRVADILLGIWPFAVVIAGVLVLKIELIVTVVAVIAVIAAVGRVGGRDLFRAFRKGAEFQIVTLVIGVAAFQHVLSAAGIVEAVPVFFSSLNLPEVFALLGLPMLIGLITGVTLAYIAVSFPLLLPLMGGDDVNMTLVMFAYAAGFVGVLLSPVHLCLVLAREYFSASLGRAYRILMLPSALIMAVATVLVMFFS